MSWLLDALIYHLPWPIQVLLLAIPVLVAFWLAVQVFGFERVKGWIAPAVAILAAFGMVSRAQQKGYNDRRAEEEKALDKAEEITGEIEKKVEALPDAQLDGEIDRWSRK